MSDFRNPAGAPESVSERFFWFITAFATLALGGFIYFGYVMFFPGHPHGDAAPKVAAAPAAATPANATDEKSSDSPPGARAEPVEDVATKAAAGAPNVAESKAVPEPSQTNATPTVLEMPAPPRKDEPETNPYMVPENKPFLTHDMFEKKPPPKAVAAVPPKPKVPGKSEEKPKAAPARSPEATAVSTAASLPVVRGKIYVLKDGRRIPTVSTVDMGDSYGVKDLNSSYITIPKADVNEVINR